MWRAATRSDDARVVELYLALNAEDPCTTPPDAERMRRTLEQFRSDPARGACLVLDEAGGAGGYALIVPYWSNELGGNVTFLDELYVSPAARGRGRASELIALLASRALGWPDTVALQLEVSPSNARARDLYERHGFAPIRNTTLRRTL
ncbi:MAG TPA: GNAT family N-acetyltransferase [Anaeromyxobacteraceae bacterium]|nr:GNAT family N-acetyltransferase [Anaeromyxobacteraceae bacterium]